MQGGMFLFPFSAGETTEINADVLNSLPKWAQGVVQAGCFNEVGDDEDIPTFATQAIITADSVEKHAEFLEELVHLTTDRQQLENFERNGVDVFREEEVNMLLQTLKAMENDDNAPG
eukprot:jgi/Phyca11/13524/fgenesh1_pg.PHYCAscaffold_4_\